MIQDIVKKTLISLIGLFILMAALGWAFQEEIIAAAHWLAERLGYAGVLLVVFTTDALITGFPPDTMLVVISRSDMNAHWPLYVLGVGFVSALGGVAGYFIGRWLEHFPTLHAFFGRFREEHGPMLKKYGFWWVVLGATTPLPFSVTCWTAGMLRLPLLTVVAGCLFRVPRFYLYYWLIDQGLAVLA